MNKQQTQVTVLTNPTVRSLLSFWGKNTRRVNKHFVHNGDFMVETKSLYSKLFTLSVFSLPCNPKSHNSDENWIKLLESKKNAFDGCERVGKSAKTIC